MIEWSYPLVIPADITLTSDATDPTFSGLPALVLQFAELALDDVTGDLPKQPYIKRGPDAVIQRIRFRFQFFKGEWFLDQRLGVPYRELILIKNPDPIIVAFVFRQVLRTTPGVRTVTKFDAIMVRKERHLVVDFQAKLTDGAIITAAAEPFIIEG